MKKKGNNQKEFRPQLQLIDGLHHFLLLSDKAGIKMAIDSAAIQFNIDFVLDDLNIRRYFDALVSADDVKESKPSQEKWLTCSAKLGVLPAECVVFEDSPEGVEAAVNAGTGCAVITTSHQKEEFERYSNILLFTGDFELIRM